MLDDDAVDLDQATEFLKTKFDGRATVIEYVAEGEWSRCFGFTLGDDNLVVRFGKILDDFRKDERASAYSSADLPVPEVLEIGDAYTGHFAIARRVRGTALERLSPAGFEAAVPSLVRTLNALRAIDVGDTAGYGRWNGAGVGEAATWRQFLLGVEGEGLPYARLCDLVGACPEARYLIHCDLINNNVFVVDGHITAVLDWGFSHYGDFLYELARLVFWSWWHDSMRELDVAAILRRHFDGPNYEERMLCYQLHVGLYAQHYMIETKRWDVLERTQAQVLALAKGASTRSS